MVKAEYPRAKLSDAEILADIRAEAMRPSLEALGRFDPVRARQRFFSKFDANDTQLILLDSELVGFFVVRAKQDHFLLDHLYLNADAQGLGLGREVVQHVQNIASNAKKPIKLMALKNSPANDFYVSLGFVFVAEDEFDNFYEWHGAKGR